MKEDPILAEIHQTRAKMLEEAGGDMRRLMERLRAREAQEQANLISHGPSAPREIDRESQ